MDITNDEGWPLVAINDDGIRPAGKPDECFYCHQKIGQPHKKDCGVVKRKVLIRYTFEIVEDVPHYWTEQDFDFNRNESSWCLNNALDYIREYADKTCGCTCFLKNAGAELVRDVDDTPHREINPTTLDEESSPSE